MTSNDKRKPRRLLKTPKQNRLMILLVSPANNLALKGSDEWRTSPSMGKNIIIRTVVRVAAKLSANSPAKLILHLINWTFNGVMRIDPA